MEQLLLTVGKVRRQINPKLKIFFGYAAGVGKTYAMLEAAHQAQKEGIDVVAVSYTHLDVYKRQQVGPPPPRHQSSPALRRRYVPY